MEDDLKKNRKQPQKNIEIHDWMIEDMVMIFASSITDEASSTLTHDIQD